MTPRAVLICLPLVVAAGISEHFPTDVIMGSMAGAGIGVLVPHFHRRPHYHDHELETPSVLIGYAPVSSGGGAVRAQWRF